MQTIIAQKATTIIKCGFLLMTTLVLIQKTRVQTHAHEPAHNIAAILQEARPDQFTPSRRVQAEETMFDFISQEMRPISEILAR